MEESFIDLTNLDSFLGELVGALTPLLGGMDSWAWAWLRPGPILFVVPYWGMRGLPFEVRWVFGVLLALCVALVLEPVVPPEGLWAPFAATELLRGLLLALSWMGGFWVARGIGAWIEEFLAASPAGAETTLGDDCGAMSVAFTLIATFMLLELGGLERLALVLAAPGPSADGLGQALHSVVCAAQLLLALATPWLAARGILLASGALFLRLADGSGQPAELERWVRPISALGLLYLTARWVEGLLTEIAIRGWMPR